jgi:hypothetical protein
MAFVDVLTHSLTLRRCAARNPPAEIEKVLKEVGRKYVINFV